MCFLIFLSKQLFTTFRGVVYSDNREIEGRIFHLSTDFNVPLFEKDVALEKVIQNFYRVRKIHFSSSIVDPLFVKYFKLWV